MEICLWLCRTGIDDDNIEINTLYEEQKLITNFLVPIYDPHHFTLDPLSHHLFTYIAVSEVHTGELTQGHLVWAGLRHTAPK